MFLSPLISRVGLYLNTLPAPPLPCPFPGRWWDCLIDVRTEKSACVAKYFLSLGSQLPVGGPGSGLLFYAIFLSGRHQPGQVSRFSFHLGTWWVSPFLGFSIRKHFVTVHQSLLPSLSVKKLTVKKLTGDLH